MIKVTVNINGMSYNLKGEKDEKYLLAVANYVDGRIKEITSKKSGLSLNDATVLAAVNIADELYETDEELDIAKKENDSIKVENEELKKKIDEYLKKVEQYEKQNNDIKEDFSLKEAELHEKYKNQEVNYKKLCEEINKLKEDNEALIKKNKEITDDAKKNKNANDSLNKELSEIREKTKIIYKKVDDAKNKEHRLNRELQQANDRVKTLNNKFVTVKEERDKLSDELKSLTKTNLEIASALEEMTITKTDVDKKNSELEAKTD